MTDSFELRRSIAPYIGLPVILFLVLVLMMFVSLKENNWTPFLVMQGVWIPIFIWGLITSRYRILWLDGVIIQKASGMNDVFIKAGEITHIEQEKSNVSTFVSFNRPFRRITIYAKYPSGENKLIDVSLKHFVTEDVRKLMIAIHNRRPDLTLPRNWM